MAEHRLNAAQERAIRNEIARLEDDLYRYSLAERNSPGQKTGNGEPFTEVIRLLEEQIAELKEGTR